MTIEVGIDVNNRRGFQLQLLDRLLAEFAARQHGVVARWQLLEVGVPATAIDYRVRRGSLHVVHRGVYAVGHPLLSVDGRRMAAVLAGGSGSALSHGDAGSAHGILESARSRFEVIAPCKGPRRPGIQFHHALLPPDEVTTLRGIPITTPSRTILDLASREPPRRIERAMHQAEVLRLHDELSLVDLLGRYPRARGTRALRSILANQDLDAHVSKEDFQERFLADILGWGLPRPEMDRPLWLHDHWIRPDCTWVEERVIAELDGYAVHGARRNFVRDRSRDLALHALRWRPLRVTWWQLTRDSAAVERDLRVMVLG
jgi:Transcriptional regulator, AbiEi antitoxin